MCPIALFSGQWNINLLPFLKHSLNFIVFVRNGTTIVDYDTTHNQKVYFKTIQSLHFEQNGPPITLKNYPNRYYLVFDLTSTQQFNRELYLLEIVGPPLRLELEFSRETAEPIEVLMIGE